MNYEEELQEALLKIHRARDWQKFDPYQFPKEFWGDIRFVSAIVKRDGYLLKDATEEMADTKEAVLPAVKNFGKALRFASKRLRDDEEVVIAAVKQDVDAKDYASERLQNIGVYKLIEKAQEIEREK